MNDYTDIEIICVCGESFIWTSGERVFMEKLKDDGKISSVQTPKRCPKCRKKSKEERERRDNQNGRNY